MDRTKRNSEILVKTVGKVFCRETVLEQNENKHRYSEQGSGYQRGRGRGRVKKVNCMVTDGNLTSRGEHAVVYTQVKNIVLHM